jgi:hypothetical protein
VLGLRVLLLEPDTALEVGVSLRGVSVCWIAGSLPLLELLMVVLLEELVSFFFVVPFMLEIVAFGSGVVLAWSRGSSASFMTSSVPLLVVVGSRGVMMLKVVLEEEVFVVEVKGLSISPHKVSTLSKDLEGPSKDTKVRKALLTASPAGISVSVAVSSS